MIFTTRGFAMNNNQFEQLMRQMQDRVKSDPANPDAENHQGVIRRIIYRAAA